MLESVIVLLIVLAVVAICLPRALAARQNTQKQVCVSNLRRLWMAVELYRNDNGGGVDQGTFAEMALPPDPSVLAVSLGNWNGCNGETPRAKGLESGYAWLAGTAGSEAERAWGAAAQAHAGNTVLLSDWHHNPVETFGKADAPKLAQGTTLNGQLLHRASPGTVYDLAWWFPAPVEGNAPKP